GEATRARGDIDRAADFFQRAIHTLEAQISNLGSSHDVKASFRAQHGEYYRNSIETLLQLHRPDDAFATQEGSRARTFLALLTERDLIFSDVPEDLDRERRRLAFRYEHTQEQLKDLNPRDHADRIDQLTSQLRDLRRQYDDSTEKIRRVSPKFTALRYPEPLDLEGVRQALDPGTVMLSYSVGEEQTDLFVLTREGPLRVHSLAIGEEILRDQLARFDRQVRSHGGAGRYAKGRFNMARWLFSELIEPASETIEKSDRLLLVPDGLLHRLPFAALIRETASRDAGEQEGDSEHGWQYLVEWKPLHTVLSGTVYAELR
ncbi:MAG: CHAT domain-containing protein, partial [bacterium]|nr:CHAT domain-containing protein [bacterium]